VSRKPVSSLVARSASHERSRARADPKREIPGFGRGVRAPGVSAGRTPCLPKRIQSGTANHRGHRSILLRRSDPRPAIQLTSSETVIFFMLSQLGSDAPARKGSRHSPHRRVELARRLRYVKGFDGPPHAFERFFGPRERRAFQRRRAFGDRPRFRKIAVAVQHDIASGADRVLGALA